MVIATDDIYENYDVTGGKFKKEITDSNKKIQSSELTGADGVKIRSFRAAAVCLTLLCVLLLTAVIVLCVMLISKTQNLTNERDQLISKTQNLTTERDQVIFMNENLTRERDQLQQEKSYLQQSLSDGWTCYQSSLYFISSEAKSWSESKRYCRDRGADLIIINNLKEQEFVNMISGYEFWIGLSRVEGGWKWVDGSELNTGFWAYREPNGYTGYNCARSVYSQWYGYYCDYNSRWICEKSILPNVLP